MLSFQRDFLVDTLNKKTVLIEFFLFTSFSEFTEFSEKKNP